MRALPLATTLVLSGCVSDVPDGVADARKTPDGLPPSVEDVCDAYSGGAYGLCTAYCEAMDCDDPGVHASASACEHVATNFTKKTGDPLPCESEPVTCIDAMNDDYTDLDGASGFLLTVFDNDIIVGAAGLDEIVPTQVGEGGLISLQIVDQIAFGHIFGISNAPGTPFDLQFEYTACCDGGPCDTATVTIEGS